MTDSLCRKRKLADSFIPCAITERLHNTVKAEKELWLEDCCDGTETQWLRTWQTALKSGQRLYYKETRPTTALGWSEKNYSQKTRARLFKTNDVVS